MQQWEMNEQFIFPNFLGSIVGTPSIQVKPNWQQQVEKDSILVNGVYVIKGHVQFDFVPIEQQPELEGILLEHIDVEQDRAYFEYAIPFSIDFPNEDIEKITIQIISPQFVVEQGSLCSCSWQVGCEVEKKQPVVEEIQAVKEKLDLEEVTKAEEVGPQEEVIAEQLVEEKPLEAILNKVPESDEEADFFEQLAEAYSIVQVHMKKVEHSK